MNLDTLTSQQAQLFIKLPVVFSQDAWQEAIYLEQPTSLGELGYRLSETLQAAYACLIDKAASSDTGTSFYDFGLYRFLPRGDRVDRHWLALRLVVERNEDTPASLRIMLRDESYSLGMKAPEVFFEPGMLMMTQGVHALLEQGLLEAHLYLNRHLAGDWGDLCDEDRLSNQQALQHGERLFSSYDVNAGDEKKLWIITERDRSVTTLLLPHEY